VGGVITLPTIYLKEIISISVKKLYNSNGGIKRYAVGIESDAFELL